MFKNKIFVFVFALIVPQLAGFIGSLFTTPQIGIWYRTLVKPSFNPPNWLFAPVWTALFLCMGIALGLVLLSKATRQLKTTALIVFVIQLILNVAWSFIFFYLHQPFWAFLEIIVLLAMIAVCAVYFYRINRAAGLLFAPYALWVLFASILNLMLWRLN